MISNSHKLGLVPWAESLSDHGHEVYWWAPGVALDKYQPKRAKHVDHFVLKYDMTELMEEYKTQVWTDLVTEPHFLTSLTVQLTPMCETVIVNFNESFRDVISRDYDVIIVDEVMNPCGYLIAHLTKAQVILHASTCRQTRQTVNLNNIPSPYGYVGCIGDRQIMSDRLSLVDRFRNTISWIKGHLADQILYYQITNMLKQHYSDLQDIRASVVRPSFQFISMPQILDFPSPFQRNLVYLGGLNMYMNQDDSSFDSVIDTIPNEFIVMATGHWGSWETAPAALRQTFVQVFNMIPKNYTIVWQYVGPPLPDLGSNVKLLKWLPQRKFLGTKETGEN